MARWMNGRRAMKPPSCGRSTVITRLRFLRRANTASEQPLLAYGISIIAVVVATLARFGLKGHILSGTPFITFFPAVVVTTFFCGLWPGVVALILSAIASWYFFLPPFYSLSLDADALVALLTFLLLAGVDVAIWHKADMRWCNANVRL